MKIEKFSLALDKLFANGFGLVLLGVILHLMFVYGKIVYTVNAVQTEELNWFYLLVAFVAALAYSLATVVVIRKSSTKSSKALFAGFDAVAVFLLYARTADLLLDWFLLLFLATFTGLVMYQIGLIALHEAQAESPENIAAKYEVKIKNLETNLQAANLKVSEFKTMEADALKWRIWNLKKNKADLNGTADLLEKLENRLIEIQ